MKLLCFLSKDKTHIGVKLDDGILDLTASGYFWDLTQTISDFTIARKDILALCASHDLPLLDEADLTFLPPASPTSKILCVGLNYKLHVDETSKGKAAVYPENPILFSKFNNALNAHRGAVTLPRSATNFDYEAELVAVIGKGGMDIPKEKAADHVFGYTCGNDVSARDAQNLTPQWLIGKTMPGFAPIGPWIVTADELDPACLAITCRRGDKVVQRSSTDQMIFDVASLVSFASRYIRLEPGDLIFTGTPSGVILGMDEAHRQWLRAGDEVTVSIEGIGELTSRFVQG